MFCYLEFMADQVKKNASSAKEIIAHGTDIACGFFDEQKKKVRFEILIVKYCN